MSSRARWWLALVAMAIVVIAIGVLVIRKVADVPADRRQQQPAEHADSSGASTDRRELSGILTRLRPSVGRGR